MLVLKDLFLVLIFLAWLNIYGDDKEEIAFVLSDHIPSFQYDTCTKTISSVKEYFFYNLLKFL